MVAMPVVPDAIVSMALPVLALMREKGVNVSVMLPLATSRETVRRLKGLAQVRTREQMFGGGIISDDNQIIILLGEDPEGFDAGYFLGSYWAGEVREEL